MSQDRKNLAPSGRALAASLLMSAVAFGATGCIEDTDCGVCDPDNLILTSISGSNYAGKKIHLVSPDCEGDACPKPFEKANYFIEDIKLCHTTEEAEESARGGEDGDFCKLAPIVTTFGLEFVFNNLLDAESIEMVRKRPDNPQLFEVYDWHSDILTLEGPITRYNGDFFTGTSNAPDLITRYVNLACVDNLRLAGQDYSDADYKDPATNPCNAVGANGLPMKTWAEVDAPAGYPRAELRSYRGAWEERTGSCDTPEEGADTCCNICDFELSVNVAKYGVTPGTSEQLNPHLDAGTPGAALRCDPAADKYAASTADGLGGCRGFETWTNREDEIRRYTYAWSSADMREEFRIPYYDKLRETHPDDRPLHLEDPAKAPACADSQECLSATAHNLPGSECVGTRMSDGSACSMDVGDPDCQQGVCRSQWFVSCRANPDTTGGDVGYCVDRRFNDNGAGACMQTNTGFDVCDPETGTCTPQGPTLLALCDADENGILSGEECCQDSLGGPDGVCDPLFQAEVRPINNFMRNSNLPDETAQCVCRDDYETFYANPDRGLETCIDIVRRGCADSDGNIKPEREGKYAVKFVSKVGGVIYDPAIKGFEYRPAHIGNVQRSLIEACSENRTGGVGERNIKDGWRMNDPFTPHSFEDYDRAMCSDSTYTVVFNNKTDEKEGGKDAENLLDKVGNDMTGKERYTFTTSAFHIIPGSGFPTNNLRIGACDDFAIKFSNKFDMSAENLEKIRILRLVDQNGDGTVDDAEQAVDPTTLDVVAGGPGCSKTKEELDAGGGPPCLTVNVDNQWLGEVGIQIDPTEFGAVLETTEWYRVWVPALDNRGQMDDPQAYRTAFWDVCGMPLIAGTSEDQVAETVYAFQIDTPKCKEDKDLDGVQLSCDNAPDHPNPGQEDTDGDGFGDVVDLCPLVAGTSIAADSDKDGVGNECDTCRQTLSQYNMFAEDEGVKAYMQARNIPAQADADGDGIGDVCDNCSAIANCEDYDSDSPWGLGDPIAFDNINLCQRDDNQNMIGDACSDFEAANIDPMNPVYATPQAVGAVGFEDDDDFDQDGIRNILDFCPRQPVPNTPCTDDADCPGDITCSGDGMCNHLDTDGDQVGNECDTCPFAPNPLQTMEGGMQEDDEDEDFVGSACETNSGCYNRKDPRPLSFHEVAVDGFCCTVRWPEFADCTMDEDCASGQVCDVAFNGKCAYRDPDGLPIRKDETECTEAQEAAGECRSLPAAVRLLPGIVDLPPGCDDALAAAGIDAAQNATILTVDDFGGDIDLLWEKMCFLPQWDQDFDGLGDQCDLCRFAFDPSNAPFVDENGRVWPKAGAFCNGDYEIEKVCDALMPDDTGGSGSGTAGTGGGSGGGSTSG